MIQKHQEIHMSVPNDARDVSIVRLAASGIANKMGFSYEDIDEIKMAISEACNHIVRATKNKEINIAFDMYKKKLVFTIDNYHANLKGKSGMEERRISKVFIDNFMDKVEYGDKLSMTRYLH